MGAQESKLDVIADQVQARVGRISLSGRYHRPPKKLDDDYVVAAKVLGSGYNGVVREATRQNPKEKNEKQKFAVKAFKLSNLSSQQKAQLEGEVEISLCMDHPHVARLFDVYESQEFLHLVMECMEGGELYERIVELKTFSERDAADTVWQMLLAVNYLHSHGIVHRDLKLENFLYDVKGSSHLKLIDFGFSKVWDPNMKMQVSCGTLAYVAPEVLKKNYTSQCDLWSLGVIVFILLSGYMPFSGSETAQTQNISKGKYNWRPERWKGVSQEAKDFTTSLLVVNPELRLTAQTAMDHAWMAKRHQATDSTVDAEVVSALRQFGQASKFRRCCLEMMAWSLSNDERKNVREYFIKMDKNKQGTITLGELKSVLVEQFKVPDAEACQIFNALDSNHDEEIHYSDFLAAMVSTRIALHDDLLRATFNRFDKDSSGYITSENLKEVIGDAFEGENVETLLKEADQLKDGRISYAEFVAFLRQDAESLHEEATAKVIDSQLQQKGTATHLRGVKMLTRKPPAEASTTPKLCCFIS
mmetsp:Transcript_111660/g.346472  ORF Transcript_111660/g.346472 Transcript_111660/m.346472 type:complete len:530 (-) Transcript_111660:203-1792(-)